MVPKVLIVDDDQPWLRLLQKELEEYADSFSVVTAKDGKDAIALLKTHYITILVTDLRMPGVDGFELLSHVLKDYPDIPVIVSTAFNRPKTKEVVLKSGAYDYVTKPFTAAYVADKIVKTLKKKAEGGSLHNVSLETFLQLIEMEQQTCTLRVTEKKGHKMGVLFFKDGELMNARIGDRQGKEAAYEILSWSGVSLSIEHSCVITEKIIDGGLQALLLDAMRTKDESREEALKKTADATEILLDDPVQHAAADNSSSVHPEAESATVPKAKPQARTPQRPPDMTPIPTKELTLETVRQRLERTVGNRSSDIEDVHVDSQWGDLVYQATGIGETFDAGELSVVYVNKGRDGQFVIVAGAETVVVSMNADTPRDRIIDSLA